VTSSPTDLVIDVTMPQMGVSVVEGTIVAWHVQPGGRIEADATICEISTDKIDTEVPAPASGTVTEIVVPVGDTVDVGTVLARIATGDGVLAEASTTPESAQPNGNGHHPVANGSAPAVLPAARTRGQRGYSPVVQRIAAEHGIDLSQVTGTGRDGRVRKPDVLAFVTAAGITAGGTAAGGAAAPAQTEDPPLHIESPYRPDPVSAAAPGAAAVPGAGDSGGLSRMRRQIGTHMKRSLDTAATCTTWAEADMSRIEMARTALGFTALPLVAQATIAALREHPALNAELDGEQYTRHRAINLGIAVSLGDDGLIVPVIHNAHELSVEGLSARIRDLARRARSRKLTPDEVSGGTFTITNPGQYGSIMATPIINQPQVGILDLEAVVKRPVVITDADGNDSIAIRPMTILGLSWDHRALDGVQAAQFLASVKRHLERWAGE
jgi:pyruvate/2-oxoglutarate dehydrogenase complex dihydrolipoamide acyltransferase (E2) component